MWFVLFTLPAIFTGVEAALGVADRVMTQLEIRKALKDAGDEPVEVSIPIVRKQKKVKLITSKARANALESSLRMAQEIGEGDEVLTLQKQLLDQPWVKQSKKLAKSVSRRRRTNHAQRA